MGLGHFGSMGGGVEYFRGGRGTRNVREGR